VHGFEMLKAGAVVSSRSPSATRIAGLPNVRPLNERDTKSPTGATYLRITKDIDKTLSLYDL